MLRVARLYTSTAAVAEEVVQETWVGVIKGIDRFESRSSLKTWIFRILTNTAKTRGIREGRSIPFASLAAEASAAAVDPERFLGDDTGFPGALGRPAAAVGGRCPAARARDARRDRADDRRASARAGDRDHDARRRRLRLRRGL